MSSMDVHSSSLLSPAPAPIELVEERSALSQQYSETVSNVPDLNKRTDSGQSSLRPLGQSADISQECHSITDEAVLLGTLVTDLKNLEDFYKMLILLLCEFCLLALESPSLHCCESNDDVLNRIREFILWQKISTERNSNTFAVFKLFLGN